MPIVFPVDVQDSRISRERPGRGTEKTRTVMLGAVKDLKDDAEVEEALSSPRLPLEKNILRTEHGGEYISPAVANQHYIRRVYPKHTIWQRALGTVFTNCHAALPHNYIVLGDPSGPQTRTALSVVSPVFFLF